MAQTLSMSTLAQTAETISERVLDPYDRIARLYPGLLALSPMPVMVVCIYGQQRLLASGVITLLISCGCSYALTRIVRDSGKRLQDSLFKSWGGAPTTQLLRHSDGHFDVHTKERFHKVLSRGLAKKLPTAAAESADPQAADELYRAGAAWLISQTRDNKRFALLLKENMAFGFQRNALGIRKFAVTIAVGCFAFCLFSSGVQNNWTLAEMLRGTPTSVWISTLYSIFLSWMWLFLFNEPALKRTAFSYAERLIQSADNIGASKTRATKKS